MNSSNRNEYKLVKSFFKNNLLNYIFGISALIVVDVFQLLIPGVISNIIDSLNENLVTPGFVGKAVLKIIFLATGMFLLRFVWRLFIVRSARKFEYETLNTLFSKIVSLTPGFFDRIKSGDIMARFTNDLKSVRMMMGPAVVVSVDAVFMTGLTIYFMGTKVDWKLTSSVLVPLFSLIPLARYFGTNIHKRFEKVQSSFSALSGFTEEAVSGARIVKSFSVFENMDKLFSERAKRNLIENIKVVRIWGIFGPMVQLVASSAFLLSLFIGGRMVIKGSITLGEFIAFNTYIGMLIWPMMAYGWLMNIVQRGKASLKRLGLILNAIPEVKEPENPVPLKRIEEIVVKDLTYS
ncbi:MAG TPA: ABC transporter ATP-binding protein, partial [Thermotoga sp.]|nr:ABC transporter ATP-binding protein [Thermotoga sp.]